jgi:O-methyltransferase involved in polyketide biosynthesis
MTLPKSLRWVEVDYPHVIELKEARLADEQPRCRLERIKLDLTDWPARRQLFADIGAQATKVLVLTEGVVPYLTESDVAELADDLRQKENVCYWIIDYFSPVAIRYGDKMRARFMRNAPFRFAPKDWFGFSLSIVGAPARFDTSPPKPNGSAGPFPCRPCNGFG